MSWEAVKNLLAGVGALAIVLVVAFVLWALNTRFEDEPAYGAEETDPWR